MFGVWEPNISKYVKSILKEGDIAIDVGANIGWYTLLFASCVGDTGHVYSIEASPSIYTLLQRNILDNSKTNITSVNVAISDQRGRATIFKHDAANIGATTINPDMIFFDRHSEEAQINTAPLFDIIPMNDILRARLIKIDVEGMEWKIVQSMSKILPQMSSHSEFILEVNQRATELLGGSISKIIEIFASAGFDVHYIPNDYRIGAYISRSTKTPEKLSDRQYEVCDLLFKKLPR